MKRILNKTAALAFAATLALAGQAAAGKVSVDPAVKGYKRAEGVSGNLNSVGSDTLNNLMTLWAEGFQRQYPNVKIQVEGKGSSTAPPALIAGTAQLGPMSREMKGTEIDEFEKKYGYKPTQIRVSLDALSVYVNKDNPVEKLTLPQVDAIFSKTRKSGEKNITDWKQVGGNPGPISLYGRNSASGTYGFFKETALFKGDFKNEVKEQPGSASVVLGVTRDKGGIGYSGMGYKTSGVKAVKIAKAEGAEYVVPNAEGVYNGKYPLKRYLYIYINKAPNKELSPLVGEFVKFVLSRDGQEMNIKDGFLPLPASVDAAEADKL